MRFLAISLIFALSCNLCLALSVRQNPSQITDSKNDSMNLECIRNFEIISHDADYHRLYACIGNTIVPLRCRHCLRMQPNQIEKLDTDIVLPSFRAKEQGCLVVCGDNTNGQGQVGASALSGGIPGLGGLGNQLGNTGQQDGSNDESNDNNNRWETSTQQNNNIPPSGVIEQ